MSGLIVTEDKDKIIKKPTLVELQLAPLKKSIVDKPPYISGTFQLPPSWFSLFYNYGDTVKRINLANPTFNELEQLEKACEPASFGRRRKKSWTKLPKGSQNGPRIFLHPTCARSHRTRQDRKGSFFKPHVDTPRGKNMFGSLVIVFPTAHEGGTLHLRDDGQEWTFNSGLELAELRTPTVGYIAFFSDIEHEVAPVISGHRVTLTYNLYFDDDDDEATDSTWQGPYRPLATNERAILVTLESLLENPEFLADGGTLGFGLQHIYPVSEGRNLRHIYGLLKGSDVAVYRSFRTLGFEPMLYLYYEWEGDQTEATIIDKVFDICGDPDYTDVTTQILDEGGISVWHEDDENNMGRWDNLERVHWVTPVTKINRRETPYPMGFRKYLSVEMLYGDCVLLFALAGREKGCRIRKKKISGSGIGLKMTDGDEDGDGDGDGDGDEDGDSDEDGDI
ncbi:hypothetical protein B0F90DRAFT_1920522 [Multifurca ochricompacta]|uniref:Prolyl 4-hydroxylase alpha subunit Fe(2+) 2OG dioxygenase domain-containing protein n=1 Tax=Multifurca ochricompacta TaxID=376703 RepID=A0AAD4LV36_9AGAM|nr:hypothetical protein B0F90DRAFT_1920522 [Multifurca ochricompacta]